MEPDRRTRFQDIARRFNPTAPPALALREALYVDPPDAVSGAIGTSLELDPASSHLLLGGIGSGKTTQLLMVRRFLRACEIDVPVKYLDVGQAHDVEHMGGGVLLSLVGLELIKRLPEAHEDEVKEAVRAIQKVANGHWTDAYEEDGDHGDPSVWSPGVLKPQKLPLEVRVLRANIRTLLKVLGPPGIFLFDGLDRVPSVESFQEITKEDLSVLRDLDVGVVLTGPPRLLYRSSEEVRNRFDEWYHNAAIDPEDSRGADFLAAVVRKRASEDLVPTPTVAELIGVSGGILRDLVGLTRSAGEEAYRGGAESVRSEHVEVAVQRFGRKMALGLTAEEVQRLRRLHVVSRRSSASINFSPSGDEDVDLLVRRAIIEYPGVPVRYAIHPVLVPLLSESGRGA